MNRHFEIPKNDEGGDEKSEKPRKMSRREFLKCGGSAAALALLPFGVGLFAETPRALSKEVNDGDSWIEGLRSLRDEALHKNTESLAIYVTDQRGNGSWENFKHGEISIVRLSNKIIENLVRARAQKIKIAHTHTLYDFGIKRMNKKEIMTVREGEAPYPSMPPGNHDLRSVYSLQAQFGSPDTEISALIVDPKGVWEISADFKHDFTRRIFQEEELFTRAFTYLSKQQDILRFIKENPHFQQRDIFIDFLMRNGDWSAFEDKTIAVVDQLRALQQNLFSKYVPILTAIEKEANAYITTSIKNKAATPARLIELYRKIGLHISFQSFKELEKTVY